MSIEAVAALSAAQIGAVTEIPAIAAQRGAGVFDNLVTTLQSLNTQMTDNQQSIQSLAVGDTDELHRVIMNLESTKLSFDLALQIRNKVLDAYQEMMRMQL